MKTTLAILLSLFLAASSVQASEPDTGAAHGGDVPAAAKISLAAAGVTAAAAVAATAATPTATAMVASAPVWLVTVVVANEVFDLGVAGWKAWRARRARHRKNKEDNR